jgi:hypothetical protein
VRSCGGLWGHARQFLRLVRGHVFADDVVFLAQSARQRGGEVDEQRIGAIGIDTGPGFRLVQFCELFFSPVHWGHADPLAEIDSFYMGTALLST